VEIILNREGKGNYLLRTFKVILCFDRDSKEILVAVDQAVADRNNGGVSSCQTDTSDVLNGSGEVAQERRFFNVEDAGSEDVTRIEDLLNNHTICEGRNVQHIEKGCFRSTDFGSLVNKMDFIHNFNGTTGNLRGNSESLKISIF
jgi:hypothetical protein